MKRFSLLRRFNWRFRDQARSKKLPPRPSLSLEALESRDLLSAVIGPPKILSVVPANGGTVTSSPSNITITFNETMDPAANGGAITNVNTYKLFDTTGATIPLSGVTLQSSSAQSQNDQVVLSVAGSSLPAGTYTLFARADQLFDLDEHLPVAPPGQLAVANTGRGTVSTIAMPGNNTLGAVSNYPAEALTFAQSFPQGAAVADLDGDGHPDLITVASPDNAIALYAGLPGGGYDEASPIFVLPAGNPLPSQNLDLVVADFNGDGKPDIAYTDTVSGVVRVFMNASSGAGDFTFNELNPINVGTNPVGLVTADFNNDGRPDLATVDSFADGNGNFNVQILINNFTGGGGGAGFNQPVSFSIGNTNNSSFSLQSPTGLTSGRFNAAVLSGAPKLGIAVSGANGVGVLEPLTGAGVNFNPAILLSGPATTSVSAGVFRAGAGVNARQDIVATTATGGQLEPFVNDNTGNFTATGLIDSGAANPTDIHLVDLTGTGAKGETLFADNSTIGTVNLLPTLDAGSIIDAAGIGGTITVTTASTAGLRNNDVVVITGVQGNTIANNTWFITNVVAANGATPGSFDLVGSSGTSADVPNTGGWTLLPGSIGTTTGNGVGPIVVTSPNHGLVTGDVVTISGVRGNTAANGTWTVTRINANTFSLNGSTGNGGFTLNGATTANPPRWVRKPYSVDANPNKIAFGDANSDGILDVLVANSKGGDVSIVPGAGANGVGNGSLLQSNDISVGQGSSPRGVAAADLNNDGIPDLVSVNFLTNTVSVLLGLTGGGYAAPVSYSTLANGVGRGPVAVAVGDVNGDGLPDIVTVDSLDNRVSVLLNNGNGTFGPASTYAVGLGPTDVVLGDVNNDGTKDIIVSHNGTGLPSNRGVTVLLGNGDGTYRVGNEVPSAVGIHATGLATADFNHDGNLDIAVLNNQLVGPGQVVQLLGNGSGGFTNNGAFDVGFNPQGIAVDDFNRDGFPDVVTVSGSPTSNQNISVLINSSGTGFQQAKNTSLPAGFPLASVTTANINQDGFPDLVVGLKPGIITQATNNGAVTGVVIRSANHGLRTGDLVTVAGVLEQQGANQVPSAINGTWFVNVINNNVFELTFAFLNGAYVPGTGVWFSAPGELFDAAYNNVRTLIGNGDGTFQAPIPYQVGGQTTTPVGPSSVTVVSDPFQAITTFNVQGNLVRNNLIANGGFEFSDLSGEHGNLNGWQTFKQNRTPGPGSAGDWSAQTGTSSPLSLATVPAPKSGNFSAMLDEPDVLPIFQGTNLNNADSYAGTHIIYQDVTIPSSATLLTVSFSLFIDNTGATVNPPSGGTNPSGFYTPLSGTLAFDATDPTTLSGANQQVRVDLMNPNAGIEDVGSGVIQNLFKSDPTSLSPVVTVDHTGANAITLDLTQFAGRTIRFRVAATNNQGKILVGLDSVAITATFFDTGNPTLSPLKLRDPNYLASPNNTPQSVDPTIQGQVGDTYGGPGTTLANGFTNIKFVNVDVNNDGFGGPDDIHITQFDAQGNFSVTIPNLLPGVYTMPLEVVDQAGNTTIRPFTFTVQGPSSTTWQTSGPGSIDISAAQLGFTKVTGDVISTLADPTDSTGNTIYVASAHGGVWKTTNGGHDYHVLTDHVFDSQGHLVAETIGAMAMGSRQVGGITNVTLYVGTGLADTHEASGGVGILKSTDGGASWSVVGQSTFAGAHISKMVVDPNDSNIVYVAVSWFDNGSQPGVFFTNDGGLTWTNILTPANMYPTGLNGPTLAAGTPIASVTDLIIDPADVNDRLVIGIGEIGKTPQAAAAPLNTAGTLAPTATEGVWVRLNDVPGTSLSQNRWVLQAGGHIPNLKHAELPTGQTVIGTSRLQIGRITLATANPNIEITGERVFYVLIATPPTTPVPRGTVLEGQTLPSDVIANPDTNRIYGLYKTKDNLLDFTHVMLRQEDPRSTADNPLFDDINLTGNEGVNVGAMAVDPNNAAVVYVGGSTRYYTGDANHPDEGHGIIRVDTGDMRDTTFEDLNAGTPNPLDIPNDGDDIQKANVAELIWEANNNAVIDPTFLGDYPKGPTVNNPEYAHTDFTKQNGKGEGVYWYDLAEGPVGGPAPGALSLLPPIAESFLGGGGGVHSLTFDPQGRLLVGTNNGIWRGVSFGYGYDFTTSGAPESILAHALGEVQPFPPGMSFTSLNGNLQITDLTSVAIDPTAANTYYTTQLSSGSAVTTTGKVPSWTSLGGPQDPGLIGPLDLITNNFGTFLATHLVPNGAVVRAVAPAPGSPAGTPSTIYRMWQFQDPLAYNIEVSGNGGETFTPTPLNGIFSTDYAALNTPFTVKPTKLQTGGQFFDQLLLGTDKVYLSDTSGNAWTPISGVLSPNNGNNPNLPPAGVVTALAIAPSTASGTDIFLAGTSDGKVFYYRASTSNPALNVAFTNRSPSVPAGSRINGLTFDATNPDIAYVMFTSPAGGGVFKTTNAGQTWTLLAGGLPSVAAYALVADPRTSSSAPQGTLYVGTQVGVFFSTNGGTNWAALGQGLPSAPVVDLQLNTNLNELAAAVQGRGVFVLSTQKSGPQVVASTPTTPQNSPLTTINVTFNEAIDPRTFTLSSNQLARNNVAFQLTTSSEGLKNRAQELFQTYLRRSASDGEAGFFAGELALTSQQAQAQGAANADALVVSQIVSGPEYFGNFGQNLNQTWLNQVYTDLLARLPSASENTAGLNTLAANPGVAGRMMIALSLTSGDEYERNLIAGLENKYLGTNFSRPAPANDAGINSLVGLLDQSQVTVPGLTAYFVVTTTYYTNDGEVTGVSAGVPASQQTGSNPSALAFGNFSGLLDAHGKPIQDLAVVDAGTNSVKIYKGKLGGGFNYTPAITLALPAGAGAGALVVGDFNGDGLPDIAVANTSLNGASGKSVSVFLNTTTIVNNAPVYSFAARTDYNGGTNPIGIVFGDIDGDGKKDLAVADSGLDASNHYDVTVLLGNGNGTFNPAGVAIDVSSGTAGITAPTGLALGDLNGDNLPDLAISGSNGLSVRLNASTVGAPAFPAAGATRLTSTPTTSVAIGSLDHTGIRDVAATTDLGSAVLVFQNNGQGTAFPQVAGSPFFVGSLPRDITLADLNGDGLNDIVVANATANGGLTVLRNTTTFVAPPGTEQIKFAPAVTYGSLGQNATAVAVADTNQDRMLDVAVANTGSDTFAVIPALQAGTLRTSSDLAWLQAAYLQLFHRTAGAGDINSWLPGLAPASLVTLAGPVGSISPLSITNLDPSTNQSFQLTFAPQVLDGAYTLQLGVTNQGVAIRDFVDTNGTFTSAGNAMNQNGNSINGEFPADRFVGQFAISTSDTGLFVTGLYHDLTGLDQTGRPADTPGFLALLGQVDNGISTATGVLAGRSQAIATLSTAYIRSNENIGNILTSIYLQILHRLPQGPDINAFQPGLTNGSLTEQQLQVILLASGEDFANALNDNATWVNQAYIDVLGRPGLPNDPGAQNFVNLLNAGKITRTQVAQILVYSGEALTRIVYDTYTRFLGRAPSASEMQQAITTLSRTFGILGQLTPYQSLEASLLESLEFFQTQGNTIKTWATALYARLLQRSGGNPNDPTSEAGSLAQSVIGQSQPARATVINEVLGSPEYQARLLSRDFSAYLPIPPGQTTPRLPSPGEINFFLNNDPVPPGLARDDFWLAQIFSGQEFHALVGADSSNVDWLNSLFNFLLFRPADQSAQNAFLPQFNALGNNPTAAQVQGVRYNVALAILNSLEYRADLVASLFNRYLGRSKPLMQPLEVNPATGQLQASDLEVRPFAAAMVNGATQEQIVDMMMASAEYFLNPHTFP
jgi:hypothetical protein